jgi:hypothetical protein
LQGFYDFLAILHGVVLAEHAVFIGFCTFSGATSYAAVKEIAARPWPAGSEIKIIAVIERALTPPPGIWAFPDSYAVQIEKLARKYLSGVVNHAATKFNAVDGPPIKVAAEVLSGEPKEIILDEAERWALI